MRSYLLSGGTIIDVPVVAHDRPGALSSSSGRLAGDEWRAALPGDGSPSRGSFCFDPSDLARPRNCA